MKECVKYLLFILLFTRLGMSGTAHADDNLLLLQKLQDEKIIPVQQQPVFKEEENASYKSVQKPKTVPPKAVKKVNATKKKSNPVVMANRPVTIQTNKTQEELANLQETLNKITAENAVIKKRLNDIKIAGIGAEKKKSIPLYPFKSVTKNTHKVLASFITGMNQLYLKNAQLIINENIKLKAQLDNERNQSLSQQEKFRTAQFSSEIKKMDLLTLQKKFEQTSTDYQQLQKQSSERKKWEAVAAQEMATLKDTIQKIKDEKSTIQTVLQKSDEMNKDLAVQLKTVQTTAQKATDGKDKLAQELEKSQQKLTAQSVAALSKTGYELISDEELKHAQAKESRTTVRSYSVGYVLGQAADSKIDQLVSTGEKMDRNVIIKGFTDRMNRIANIPTDDMKAALDSMDKSIKANQEVQSTTDEEKNKAIMRNAGKIHGAVKTTSGFIYVVNKPGGKEKVTTKSNIRLRILEKLGSGKIIAGEKDNNIFTGLVKEMPPILQEVVIQLGVTGEATLYIPPYLAYGKKGVEGKIPPNSLSIMNITVLGVKA